MPITVVASLPPSVQTPAAETASDADTPAAEQDFARLLLGQLAAPSGTAPASELPPRSGAKDKKDEENGDIPDALALLAALNAPLAAQGNETAGISAVGRSVAASGETVLGGTGAKAGEAGLLNGGPDRPPTASTDKSTTAATALSQESAQRPATIAVAAPASGDDHSRPAPPSSDLAPTVLSAVSPHLATAGAGVMNPAVQNGTRSLAVDTPLHDPRWGNDLSQKIIWLVSNQKQSAELTLNPPNMGSIDVSLRIDNGHATATFVSTNAEVRDCLETALPRLRETLAGLGISLGQANVSAESGGHASYAEPRGRDTSPAGTDNAILSGISHVMPDRTRAPVTVGRGLIDLFA